MPTLHPELADLLIQREKIIADHGWRDRDSEAHLQALIEVSRAIDEWKRTHSRQIDPRLSHYLDNASYGKALSHLQSGGTAPHHA